MGTPETGTAEKHLWAEIACDEAFAEKEARVEGLVAELEQAAVIAANKENYYWRDGVPLLEVSIHPCDSQNTKQLFTADREPELSRPTLARATLGRLGLGRPQVAEELNSGFAIVEENGQQYIRAGKKSRTSPLYDSIIPLADREFSVRSGEHTARVRILNSDEHGVYGRAQANAEKLDKIQTYLAEEALAKYGITIGSEEVEEADDDRAFVFKYANNTVWMGVRQGILDVAAWDAQTSLGMLSIAWRGYANRVCSLKGEIPQPKYMTDIGVPILFPQHTHRLPVADMRNGVEMQENMRILSGAIEEFSKRNRLRTFSVETPHVSWSIPVAMKLLELPFEQAHEIVASRGTTGALYQERSGTFISQDTQQEWKISGLHT